MQEFFSFIGKDYQGVVTLSLVERILPIVISIIIIVLIKIFNKQIKSWNLNLLKKTLGIVLFITWLSYFLWYIIHGEFGSQSLPISLCSLTSIGFVIVLLSNNKFVLDIVFYWGFIGGLLAMLFVGDVYKGIEHFRYYQFYLDHGLIFVLPFYFMFIENYKPTIQTSLKSYFSLILASFMTLPVNLYYKMDYMIMNPYNAPKGTPADLIAILVNKNLFFYIAVLMFIGFIVYSILYIMFKIMNSRNLKIS